MVTIEELKKFPIFQCLSDFELENIQEITKKENFDADRRVFEEKSIATNLYLVSKGRVVIKMRGDSGNDQLPIDTIGPGEIFGWSAVAEPHTFTAAAHTLEKSEFLVINSDVLRDLFKKNYHIGYKVMREIASVISSRLRSLNQKFVNSV